MSKKQYIVVCGLSALCLILAVEEQRLAEESRVWQSQAAFLQSHIDGSLRRRLGSQKIDALFQDLANASLKNGAIRQWLLDQGIAVNHAPPSDARPPAPEAAQPRP
jgi:hypothetical protein